MGNYIYWSAVRIEKDPETQMQVWNQGQHGERLQACVEQGEPGTSVKKQDPSLMDLWSKNRWVAADTVGHDVCLGREARTTS